MRILDLFCGAGGAGHGYHLAGFDVVGVDIEKHDYRPGEFYWTDAIEALDHLLQEGTFDGWWIDAIHASPPCQRWSTATADPDRHPDLITPVRERLEAIGLPYVIEYFRPDGSRRGSKATSLAEAREAMGVDWMSWLDLKESIPPVYTKWIGEQLLEHVGEAVA